MSPVDIGGMASSTAEPLQKTPPLPLPRVERDGTVRPTNFYFFLNNPMSPQKPEEPKKAKPSREHRAEETALDESTSRYDRLVKQMDKLYEELVARIKSVQADGDFSESADVIRAGAAEFLKTAGVRLEESEALLASSKVLLDTVKVELIKLGKVVEDIERRSEMNSKKVEQLGQATKQLQDVTPAAEKTVQNAKKV